MANEGSTLRYLTVQFSQEGVAEMNGAKRALFIPQQDIRRIELQSGSGAERPVLQTVVGLIMAGLGVVGLKALWNWFQGSGVLTEIQIGIAFFLFPGSWLLWSVFRRRTFLWVTTATGTRKILFRGKIDAADLQEFLESAGREFGYAIHFASP